MKKNKWIVLLLSFILLQFTLACKDNPKKTAEVHPDYHGADCRSDVMTQITPQKQQTILITDMQKKTALSEKLWINCKLDKAAQLGPNILRVRLTDAAGADAPTYSLTGFLTMPSMPGHHDSGKLSLTRAKNGDWVMPLNFVMRGGWEILLTVNSEEKNESFEAKIEFKI